MIGKLLKERRHALGLSQTELARRAGSSQRQVSRLEGGQEAIPRRDTLERFGGVLGITLGEFYLAAGVVEVPTEEDGGARRLPAGIERLMGAMARQYPELIPQFEARRDDPDFDAQVETLAKVLGFTAVEWLGKGDD